MWYNIDMEINQLKIEFENGISIIPLTKDVAFDNGHTWLWDPKTNTLSPSINNADYHVIIRNGQVIDCNGRTKTGRLLKITECHRTSDGWLEKINKIKFLDKSGTNLRMKLKA